MREHRSQASRLATKPSKSTPTREGLVVFAKRPAPGLVKTRLASAIGATAATRLADAFLRDTWNLASSFDDLSRILVLDGPANDLELSSVDALWQQGPGDLGQRLERSFEKGLQHFRALVVIGTDSPGLPREFIEQARQALETHDAVLGPSADGGYYLIGLSRQVPGMLCNLPWSVHQTFDATHRRLQQLGFRVHRLPEWYDVDRAADLDRLQRDLDCARIVAPATQRVLIELSQGNTASDSAFPLGESS